jgi:hypothetical protein
MTKKELGKKGSEGKVEEKESMIKEWKASKFDTVFSNKTL